MPSRRVPTELNSGTYYLTLTVERWYYLFDRFNRWQLLADSLRYCQKHKALSLNGYVFMLNHLHLIVTSSDVSGFLRDFKRFTSKKIRENIEANEPQVLKLFIDGENQYRLWMDTNAPMKIENRDFYLKKLNYIHENPVRKRYVGQPEYWLWSFGKPDEPFASRVFIRRKPNRVTVCNPAPNLTYRPLYSPVLKAADGMTYPVRHSRIREETSGADAILCVLPSAKSSVADQACLPARV